MKTRPTWFLPAAFAVLACSFCLGWEFKSPHAPVADVVVSVADEAGNAVSNADVSVWFEYFTSPDNVEIRGKSDSRGFFAATHRAQGGGVFVSAGKEGHYSARDSLLARDFPDKKEEFEKAFARDKWSEKPVRLDIVLKRVLEPKRLTLHSVDPKPFPVVGKPFSLDLETLEWCPPYGQGKHADATMVFESWKDPEHRLSFMRKLTVSMPNAADGFYVAKLDSRSGFPYAYRADTNAVYRKEGVLLFDRREDRIVEQRFPADDEYLIFRTRTETNSEGRVTSAHYGRVGEKPSHLFGLKAAVWFNPDENDTNLEDGWHE